MLYLRKLTTQKKIDHENFVNDLFTTDPDPATRITTLPENLAASLAVETSETIKLVRGHKLTQLPGGPSKYTYSNQAAANDALFQYALEFYKLVESGDVLLRYTKLADDGKISTYIVFSNSSMWNNILNEKYNNLMLQVSELFDVSSINTEISESEYNDLVTSIYADINNMKNNNAGKCRLDYIKN